MPLPEGADDGARRPGGQRETDLPQHRQVALAAAVGFGEAFDFEDGGGIFHDGLTGDSARNVAASASFRSRIVERPRFFCRAGRQAFYETAS